MALKIKIAASKQDIEKAKVDVGGRYTGPLPEPGDYKMSCTDIRYKETGKNSKNPGSPMLVVRLEITEKDSPYKGFSVFNNFMVPTSSSDEFFAFQARALDNFFQFISNGKYNFYKLVEDLSNGKVPEGEETKAGTKLEQFGKFKFKPGQFPVIVRLKEDSYNGQQQRRVHFIHDAEDHFEDEAVEDILDDTEDTLDGADDALNGIDLETEDDEVILDEDDLDLEEEFKNV